MKNKKTKKKKEKKEGEVTACVIQSRLFSDHLFSDSMVLKTKEGQGIARRKDTSPLTSMLESHKKALNKRRTEKKHG